ncbi:MAG: FtsW/RodA/SpoVE family cell cycle protein, partial [Actinomycetes bacterium]
MSAPTTTPTATAGGEAKQTTTHPRRNMELLLLIIAIIIGMYAYANVDMAILGELPANVWYGGACFVVLLGGG